jgi:carbonic anhydrase
MKNNPHPTITSLLLLLVLAAGGAFTLSCSKADAGTKKEKPKKAAKEEPENEAETAETEEHTEPESEHKTESEEPVKKKGDKEEPKTGEKKKPGHDEKAAGKSPVKDSSTAADEIWGRLAAGNKRFMAGKHTSVNYAAARKSLVKGQQPEVIVLGCADSRVPPEFVFDKNLGEIFVVRDAGNIPDKVSLGSIEYAVEHLHAKALLILGHESCGAVAAAVSGEKMPTANLTAIVDTISPAFEGSKTCLIGEPSNMSCVELNVKQSAEDVVARSPILKKAVKEGKLAIIRAVYKMETGEVVRLA